MPTPAGPVMHTMLMPDRPRVTAWNPPDSSCFPADGRAAGPHRVARAVGPGPQVLRAECADVRQQPHGPVDHRGFGQQSVTQQALSCLGKVPVSAIEAEILKCVLDGGIPAPRLPQEVVKSVETWVPGRRTAS